MTNLPNDGQLFTPFLPASYNLPEEDDRQKVYLVERFSNFADVINDKKIGPYTQAVSSYNGEKWAYLSTAKVRTGYQTIAYIPSYPNSTTLNLTLTSSPQYPIASVNPEFVITLSYGTASKPCTAIGAGDGDYFTFMNKGDTRISYTMSDTQIVLTTTTNLTAYSGFIVIHYLRNGF